MNVFNNGSFINFFWTFSWTCSLIFRSSQTSATSSQTCPLCRVDINSDSGFLLAEKPKYDNVKKMLTESILSLPDDYKTRRNDSMTRSYRE
jgi:hypothetical protein